jgi:hypothetical protein
LNRVVSYEIAFHDLRELVRSLKNMLNASHQTKSVLAGYYSEAFQNKIQFFIYTSDEKLLSQLLVDKITTIGLVIEDITCEDDYEWKTYQRLFPQEEEMNSLINRTQIEQLYMSGIHSDRQYLVKFYVCFKDKNDPVTFEEQISHLGFKLTFASYTKDEEQGNSFAYFGEYQVATYITPRRIDYLYSSIKTQADEYSAKFNGDWIVDRR